ncbi:hypothetical protein LB505_011260 [Fusarium chuoi]|nr:hypothetical protein LB505_011260 [Fusarium chuoi]
MTEEKGLDGDVADRIGEWVVLKGKQDLLQKLQSTESLAANESMKKGMEDLALLFEYLEAFDCLDRPGSGPRLLHRTYLRGRYTGLCSRGHAWAGECRV